MADNSNIVLRWEIDNVSAVMASGKAESGVFNEGGFKWIITLDRKVDNTAEYDNYTLRCESDHNGPWKCEVEGSMRLLRPGGADWDGCKERFCFEDTNCSWLRQDYLHWRYLGYPQFVANNKITFVFRMQILSSEKGQPICDSSLFDSPTRRSDVILKIGDKKMHVSKEILAFHSPVFETMFFGNFSENGKEEVEIQDVVYEEFIDLLHLIYVRTAEITDRTISHILKLSDQFQIESILDLSKKHLTQSKGIDTMKKLLLADQYRLDSVRDHCLASFVSVAEMAEKLKSSPEFANFSDGMQAAICRRIVEF